MKDGREVVAKLSNPNVGRPHFTTASEVANMDFVYGFFLNSEANKTDLFLAAECSWAAGPSGLYMELKSARQLYQS